MSIKNAQAVKRLGLTFGVTNPVNSSILSCLKLQHCCDYHFVQVLPQAAQARCINYREFRYCFAYYERFEEFVWEIHYSCRNTAMNIEINCTFVNLGLLLPFRCNLGSIHGRFIRFTARCLFGVVFLFKSEQGRWVGAVLTHKSLPHRWTAHWFAIEASVL